MEIASGTGILSIFAAKAGTKRVISLENTNAKYFTEKIILDNNMSEKITLTNSPEDINIPENIVDIIVSDWMGYFLLHNSNLKQTLLVRNKYLNKNGVMIPDMAVINLAAIEDYYLFESKYRFWEKVHNIDMSIIKDNSLCEVLVENIEKENIISSICKIYEINLYTIDLNDINFSSKYELKVMKNSKMHGLVSWFDVFMNSLPYKVKFNTSPFSQTTSWKQCIFYLDEEIEVIKGDIITGSFAYRISPNNDNQSDFKISFYIFRNETLIYKYLKFYTLNL